MNYGNFWKIFSKFCYFFPKCKLYSGYFWHSSKNKKDKNIRVWRQIISIHDLHEAACSMVIFCSMRFKVFFCHELWPFLENIFHILLNFLSIFATAVDRCDIMWTPLNYSLWVCRGARIRPDSLLLFLYI